MFKQNRFLFFSPEIPENQAPQSAEEQNKAPEAVPATEQRADASADIAGEITKPGLLDAADQLKKSLGDKVSFINKTENMITVRATDSSGLSFSITKQTGENAGYAVMKIESQPGSPTKYTNLAANGGEVSMEEAVRVLKTSVNSSVQKVDDAWKAYDDKMAAAKNKLAADARNLKNQKDLLAKKSDRDDKNLADIDAGFKVEEAKSAVAFAEEQYDRADKALNEELDGLQEAKHNLQEASRQLDNAVSAGINAQEAVVSAQKAAMDAITTEAATPASDPELRAQSEKSLDDVRVSAKELGMAETTVEQRASDVSTKQEAVDARKDAFYDRLGEKEATWKDIQETAQDQRVAEVEKVATEQAAVEAEAAVPPAELAARRSASAAEVAANKFKEAQATDQQVAQNANFMRSRTPEQNTAEEDQNTPETPTASVDK